MEWKSFHKNGVWQEVSLKRLVFLGVFGGLDLKANDAQLQIL